MKVWLQEKLGCVQIQLKNWNCNQIDPQKVKNMLQHEGLEVELLCTWVAVAAAPEAPGGPQAGSSAGCHPTGKKGCSQNTEVLLDYIPWHEIMTD